MVEIVPVSFDRELMVGAILILNTQKVTSRMEIMGRFRVPSDDKEVF